MHGGVGPFAKISSQASSGSVDRRCQTSWLGALVPRPRRLSALLKSSRRRPCLRPGYRGGWQWMRDGERVAWIELRRDGDLLHLSYRTGQPSGNGREIEQATPIVWKPCRFGGARPYFACPGVVNGVACSRHVTKLYSAGSYFLRRASLSTGLCLAASRPLRSGIAAGR